ncbi:hypothetical protein ACOBV8_19690 (plasmid) [Pseudoalteromonas espejiana]
MQPRRLRKRTTNSLNSLIYNKVLVTRAKTNPEKLAIIRNNLNEYRAQTHLKRGFLLAIERFDWVFEASNDVDFICQQIVADDYIGNRLRRYPLLFKGVVTTFDKH